ncbi:MAG: TonB-dependent receptor [Saprospiraceae bacterium]|nr:TonB-dependent receptor [Saprospiraceae bacterium]
MRTIIYLIIFLQVQGIAQVNVSGKVVGEKSEALIGANIYIKGSYDGTITDTEGKFAFDSALTGEQTIVVSYLGYQEYEQTANINTLKNLSIKLKGSTNTLNAVEITASTFKAGDNSKIAVLKPLDIVTTAGSVGDVMAAMRTLPGAQQNADDGRLFVRGGDARETLIFIDGLKVFSPYTRTVQGTPARGRYSPFLFKGVSFSTGGYSSEFGNALSGTLDLSTIDEPRDTETNISLMTVGVGLGHTKKWDRTSISFSGAYYNLTPYYWLVPSRLNWRTPYTGFGGETVFRHKTNSDGLLKIYLAADSGNIDLNRLNLDTREDDEIGINNKNIYANASYRQFINKSTSIYAGISAGKNDDQMDFNNDAIENDLNGIHSKVAFKTILSEPFILNYGAEHIIEVNQLHTLGDSGEFNNELTTRTTAAFLESDYFFDQSFAIKPGLRYEYLNLSREHVFMPRLTIAKKVSKKGQISLAYGHFSQTINPGFLHYDQNIASERAIHYLANYNYKTDKHILRIEAFYKDYQKLISFDGSLFEPENVSNNGFGEAYGLDFFWRATRLIKNTDFWISYSWLNSTRDYLNYPEAARPAFAAEHNFSAVSKIWIDKLQSQLGLTYSFASGRPYENPNTPGFQNERSGYFHNVSASWSYLISQQKILFVSVSNLPGFNNEFGYRYANNPDTMGMYASELIRPSEDQFFFVGFFMTISSDKTKNQLDTL